MGVTIFNLEKKRGKASYYFPKVSHIFGDGQLMASSVGQI